MLKSKRNSISTSLRQGCYAAEAEVASCPATARMLCRRRSVSLSHSLSSFADAARLSANAFHIEIGRQVGLLVHWVNADSCAAMFVYVRRMCVWARVCELFAAFGLPVLWITFWCELLFFGLFGYFFSVFQLWLGYQIYLQAVAYFSTALCLRLLFNFVLMAPPPSTSPVDESRSMQNDIRQFKLQIKSMCLWGISTESFDQLNPVIMHTHTPMYKPADTHTCRPGE